MYIRNVRPAERFAFFNYKDLITSCLYISKTESMHLTQIYETLFKKRNQISTLPSEFRKIYHYNTTKQFYLSQGLTLNQFDVHLGQSRP